MSALAAAFNGSARAIRQYGVGADRLLVTTISQSEIAALQGDYYEYYYHGGTTANGAPNNDPITQGSSRWLYAKIAPDIATGVSIIGFKGDADNLNYYVYAGGSGVDVGATAGVTGNFNNMPSVTKTSGSEFRLATRNANPLGAEVNWDFQPGETGAGNRSSGGGVPEPAFRIYGPETEFVIELRNQSGTNDCENYRLVYQFVEAPLELLG